MLHCSYNCYQSLPCLLYKMLISSNLDLNEVTVKLNKTIMKCLMEVNVRLLLKLTLIINELI